MASWQKIITSGSMAHLSSLIVDNIPPDLDGGSVLTYLTESGKFRITGSYTTGTGGDTSSWATNAISGGSINEEFYIYSAFVSGNLQVSGTIAAAEGLTLTDITMSVSTSTGSFIFGSGSGNNTLTHEMTGNLFLSSSQGITANMNSGIVGFIGTSSFAETTSGTSSYADSASYTHTAQNLLGTIQNSTSASYALSSSFATASDSSSYSITASHAINASLPINPEFSSITTTGNAKIGGGLTVTNGSIFNSGVSVNGNLSIKDLTISSSLGTTTYIHNSGQDSIHKFTSKPGSDTDVFISLIGGTGENKTGILFKGGNTYAESTIIKDKEGLITFNGEGHVNAGKVQFIKGIIGDTIFTNNITASNIYSDGITSGGAIKTLTLTSVGGVGTSTLSVASTALFLGNSTWGTVSQGTKLSIFNSTGDIKTNGSITASSFIGPLTGSLIGTSSYTDSASYSSVSSLAEFVFSSSHAHRSFTSSYATIAQTTLGTASYSNNSTTASYSNNSTTASYATIAQTTLGTASYATNSTTASYATNSTTASYSTNSTTASYSTNSTTASYATNSTTASYAESTTTAITTTGTSSHAITASYALNIKEGLDGGGGGGSWYDDIKEGGGSTYLTSSVKVGIKRIPSTYDFEVAGNMAATQDVIAFMSSDRRLKNNIKPIEDPIGKIKKIGGYSFDWNNKQSIYKGNDFGVIAQEIEAVLPSLVQDREDGYKGVKYDKIVSLLIEAIKDQQKQIDELKKLI